MTKAERELQGTRANYAKFYGPAAKPKEVTAEVELLDGVPVVVDIAFGAENMTENHFGCVSGWSDLLARAARGAKRKFGYRVLGIVDYTASNPIVYRGSGK